MNAPAWTTPYYGVQHFGSPRAPHWLTVEDNGTGAVLLRWYPGCQFDPLRSRHADAEAARQAGEKWLAEVAA